MKPLLSRYRFLFLQILASAALGLIVLPAHANCLDQERLTGVNLAGAEFNARKIPGQVFTDYTYPSNAELDYIVKQGANIIRFPFLWERLQPQANGPLDIAELGRLRTTVQNANARGLCVLLDVHNYARYKGVKLNATLPDGTSVSSAFTAFWLALAAEFPDPTTTIFGLMNEPAAISVVDWAVIAKQTLAALRKAKATNMVFVAGGRWSGVHDWFAGLQNSNATEFDDLYDPLKRTVIEVHQYTDIDYSGTHTEKTGTGCLAADKFDAKFARINDWAKTHGQTLFLGEFGVPASSECLLTLTRLLQLMQTSPWRGWSYWAAGSWWGNYPLALSGPKQAESPHWARLKPFFYHAGALDGVSPPEPPAVDALTQ